MKAQILDYNQLIQKFTSQQITAKSFEEQFIDLFKNDETLHPEEQFLILDRLFAAVDAYCADPSLRNEQDLDEEGLRHESQQALDKLKALLNK